MSDHVVIASAMNRIDGVWQRIYTISPVAADALRDAFIALDDERARLRVAEAREARAEKNRARRVARRRERVVRSARILWPDLDTARAWMPETAAHVLREAILIDQAYNPGAWK